jgi:hypothetical protein
MAKRQNRDSSDDHAAIITFWNLALAFGMVILIAGISSYVGVRKVLKIEPFDIFRGQKARGDVKSALARSVLLVDLDRR